MRARALLLTLVVLSASLAGCSGGGDSGGAAQVSDDLSATHGTVVGLITDDEARPIEEAAVAVRTVKASPITIKIFTNAEGRFRIDNVPAGRQTVVAEKNGYEEAASTVTIIPGAENTVRLVLRPSAITEYKVVPLAEIKGFYTCAWENILMTGECDYEVYNQTGQPRPLPSDNNESWAVPSGWGGLLFEVKWRTGTVEPSMEGIRFRLESQEDLGGRFLDSKGVTSPMKMKVNAGQVAPDANVGYPIPQRGVATWIHVLPLGHSDGAACPPQCPSYGAGVALNLEYSVFITVFYGGPVDDEFSGLPPP